MTPIASLRKCHRNWDVEVTQPSLERRAARGFANLCLFEDNKVDELETEDLFVELPNCCN